MTRIGVRSTATAKALWLIADWTDAKARVWSIPSALFLIFASFPLGLAWVIKALKSVRVTEARRFSPFSSRALTIYAPFAAQKATLSAFFCLIATFLAASPCFFAKASSCFDFAILLLSSLVALPLRPNTVLTVIIVLTFALIGSLVLNSHEFGGDEPRGLLQPDVVS